MPLIHNVHYSLAHAQHWCTQGERATCGEPAPYLLLPRSTGVVTVRYCCQDHLFVAAKDGEWL